MTCYCITLRIFIAHIVQIQTQRTIHHGCGTRLRVNQNGMEKTIRTLVNLIICLLNFILLIYLFDVYVGEMSLELLSNMEHNYIPTNHSIINKERINNVFDKLSHGLSVHVIVFGGSFTAGRQAGGINNAWPDQLQRLWDASTDIVHTTKGNKLTYSFI